MDVRVFLLCGLAAGFLMCVAALASSIDMTRSHMAVAKSPICRPDQTPARSTTPGAVPAGKRAL